MDNKSVINITMKYRKGYDMKNKGLKLKDRSTESKAVYVIEHLFFGLLLGIDVLIFLPHLVNDNYLNDSLTKMSISLILCLSASCFWGIIFTYQHNRNFRGVLVDVFAGSGLYVGLTLGKYMPNFMKCLLIGTGIFSLFCIIYVICNNARTFRNRNQIWLIRFLKVTQAVRYNFGIAFTIVLIMVPLNLYMQDANLNRKLQRINWAIVCNQKEDYNHDPVSMANIDNTEEETLEVHEVYGDEFRLANNIDIISLIRDDDVFQNLSYEKKKEVVIAILRCEGRYLGLEEFDIAFKELEDDTLGQFSYSKRRITINSKPLKDGSLPGGSATKVLETCLHEARHYYSHLMVELLKKASPEQRNLLAFTGEGVASWYENIKDYHSADGEYTEEEYDAYYSQSLEQDARRYAREQIPVYWMAIDELLNEQDNGS